MLRELKTVIRRSLKDPEQRQFVLSCTRVYRAKAEAGWLVM
jgi:hypothetical protein